MVRRLLLPLVLLAALPATRLLADTVTYSATLLGLNQVPPNDSGASGTGFLSLTGNILTVDINFTGLSAPAEAAHIHCCTLADMNAPVVVPFSGVPAATSGTIAETINLSTFAFSGGGSEAALIAGLNDGQAYLNIHDANFPEGEIRGQIAASAVPEPSSLMLLGTGAAALAGLVRRKLQS